ncbi:MAG: PepSY domain-containing protein [Solirubrobacterales bacterium]|nr:PepSY domain-containing protein [Solirubrobacterales bacterium]
MNTRSKVIATGVTALALAAGGSGLAIAGSGGGEDAHETDTSIAGAALGQAKAAALDHIGQGTVSGTEVGDEESYYEVEITLDNGSQTDVQLDRSFKVVSQEAEHGIEAGDNN